MTSRAAAYKAEDLSCFMAVGSFPGETMIRFLLLFILAYVAGSVNFSILLFRALGMRDPRSCFSGNPGASNVYRQAGPRWAAVVLVLDMGRAAAVGFAALRLLSPPLVPWIGLALIAGNAYPCFHGLRGGKGVANYLGFGAVVSFPAALAGVAAWGAVFALWRKPFLSSFALVLVLAAGTLYACGTGGLSLAGTLLTAGFIFWRHRRNLRELLA
jgi:glycerol-3-phosphate acyltransferase PlsY